MWEKLKNLFSGQGKLPDKQPESVGFAFPEHKEKVIPKPTGDPFCPYCGVLLENEPKRKTKCKSCNNFIYVRSSQDYFPSWLVTEEQARVTDSLINLASNIDNAEKLFREALQKEKNPSDALWIVYNKTIVDLTMKKDFHGLFVVYSSMARHLLSEGKDTKKMMEESKKCELIEMGKILGRNARIEILVTKGDSYSYCSKLNGKKFTIKGALERMPIPGQCTNNICRCVYIADL